MGALNLEEYVLTENSFHEEVELMDTDAEPGRDRLISKSSSFGYYL